MTIFDETGKLSRKWRRCASRSLFAVLVSLFVVSRLSADPGSSGQPSRASVWTPADPAFAWSFPRDHWSHDRYRNEWWYFTGQLADPNDPEVAFGYQFTLFRIGLYPDTLAGESAWTASNLIMGHASITDLRDQRHYFTEVLWREMPLLGGFSRWHEVDSDSVGIGASGDTLAWCVGPPGTSERWSLRWNGSAFDFAMHDDRNSIHFALSTVPEKPLIFQGPNGFSSKGNTSGAASQYYSFTRLRTTGTVSIADRTSQVQGESWMDKEFGSNQLTSEQVGWDWFSLQLDNGSEVMLYMLRRRDGSVDFARGTRIDLEGRVRYLLPSEWTVKASARWRSAKTKAEYPGGWRIQIPGEDVDLEVLPLLQSQENVSERAGGLFYWEGAVEILENGQRTGRGYVELTGYGEGNRPPI